MKVFIGNRGIAPLILEVGSTQNAWSASYPALPLGKEALVPSN
jgi:hypothetical protein